MRRNRGLTFVEKKNKFSIESVRDILATLFFCFAAVLLAVILTLAFGRRIEVIGNSMEPTLSHDQSVLVDRFTFKLLAPSRGDIVCFYPKGNENSHLYIKRIVGLPGGNC